MDTPQRKVIDDESARRAALLGRLHAALVRLDDPLEIATTAAQLVANVLGARNGTAHIDAARTSGAAAGGLLLLSDEAGRLGSGQPLIVNEVVTDPRLSAAERARLAHLDVAALITVLVAPNGAPIGSLSVVEQAPRRWTGFEASLVEAAAHHAAFAVVQSQSRADLRDREERLQLALDATDLGTFTWNPVTDEAEPDRRTRALFGFADGDDTGLDATLDRIHPDDRDAYRAAVSSATDPSGDGLMLQEVRVAAGDGRWRWLRVMGRTTFAGQPPRLVRMSGTVVDVTTRRHEQERIRESDERRSFLVVLHERLRHLSDPNEVMHVASEALRDQLRVGRVGWAEVDADGTVTIVGGEAPGSRRLSGAKRASTPDLCEALPARRTIVHDDIDQSVELASEQRERYAARGVAATVTVPLVRGGESIAALFVHEPAPRAWSATEIEFIEAAAERAWGRVERVRAVADAREGQLRLQIALGAARMGTFAWTPDTNRVEGDERMSELLNRVDPDRLTLEETFARVAAGDRERLLAGVRRLVAVRDGEPLSDEIRVEGPGAPRWLGIFARSAERMHGSGVQVVGAAADITDRKRAQIALHRSEQRFRQAVEVPNQFVWVAAPDGQVEYVNQHWVTYTGVSADEAAMAVHLPDIIHPDDRARVMAARDTALRDGAELAIETRLRRVDGEYRWFATRMVPLHDEDGRVINWFGVATDIHDRRAAEEARRDGVVRRELLAQVVTELDRVSGVPGRLRRLQQILAEAAADEVVVDWNADSRSVASPNGSAISVPVRIGPDAAAVLRVRAADEDRARFWDRAEFVRELVSRLEVSLGAARLQEEEHDIALGLQRALLPTRVVEHPQFELAARYEAGSAALEVGGDWYDSFMLPGGRVGICVGDVIGSGLPAAASMGRMRVALATIAARARRPGRVLTRLDEVASGPNGAAYVTAVYAIFDPQSGDLQYASAGHPPGMIVDPDGGVRWLDEGGSPPLCDGPLVMRSDAVTTLREGSMLVLYSDGLVERRGATIRAGMDRLAALAPDLVQLTADAACDTIIERLGVRHERGDDTVVMCLRVGRTRRPYHQRFPAHPRELRRLREEVREWLGDRIPEPRRTHLLVALGEAVSNSIEHGYEKDDAQSIEVTIEDRGDSLRVTVQDFGQWRSATHGLPARGRGLGIIRTMGTDVDTRPTPSGTTIAFRFPYQGDDQ